MSVAEQQIEAGEVSRRGAKRPKNPSRRLMPAQIMGNEAAARGSAHQRRGPFAEISDDPEAPLPIDAEPSSAACKVAAGKNSLVGPLGERRRRARMQFVAIGRENQP